MRRIIVGACILAAFLVAACSRQEAAWDRAARSDTVAGYEAYLERFPAGSHAPTARARVSELRDDGAWARAERLGTPEAWQRYLGDWPQGRHAGAALGRLAAFMPPPSPSPGSRFAVQLGAFSTEQGATLGVERIRRGHGEIAGAAGIRIVPGEADGIAVFRVRAGPYTEREARELCVRLLAAEQGCVPVAVHADEGP